MTDDAESEEDREPSVLALRLTFSYSERGVEIVARQQLDMRAPPGETAPLEPARAGAWFELLDRSGQVLYQTILHDPIRHDIEAVVDEGGRRVLSRMPLDRPEGIFQVIVPDLPGTETFRLFTSAPASDGPVVESWRMRRQDISGVREGGV